MDKEIKVPNIGDFEDVEVIEVLVNKGKKVLKDDPLITIESDKSSVEIPSKFAGTVKSLNLKVGDKVSEGTSILILEIEEESREQIKEDKDLSIKEKKDQVIINQKLEIKEKKIYKETSASPKARKFARELGVNINEISGTQRDGRVVEEDIKSFISSKINKVTPTEIKNKIPKNEFQHSDFGEIETKDIPRIKKLASNYLMNSWSNIPHVTNHDEADITEMEDFRNSLIDMYTGEKKK